MQRVLMEKLIEWRNNPYKKPLLIHGIPQCGKTYLLKDFGSKFYKDILYFDFEENDQIADFFELNLHPDRIIKNISLYCNVDVRPNETLIIFDGIQSCERAIESLQFFSDKAPEYHIIAAGSLLSTSFTQIETLDLYPMNFYEFLLIQNSMLAMHLKESSFQNEALKIFKTQLEELFYEFQIVGGMPEAVQCWIDTKSIEKVNNIQRKIISSFENIFIKNAPVTLFPKLSAIWNAVPGQLIKDNRKFIFSKVKKSWRAKDLEDALYWLIRSGFVYKVERIEKPDFPISGYADPTHFKLYMCDVGLLRCTARIPSTAISDKTDYYKKIKSAIVENLVCCELKRIYSDEVYYWSAENPGRAEVEFIIQDGSDIIPIVVKEGSVSRTRSLMQYSVKFSPKKAVLTSMDNDKPDVLPLYAFWNLKEWLTHRS